MNHAQGSPPRHAARSLVEPVDRRNPGNVFLQQEIDANRIAERWLVPKALIAMTVVGVLVAVREVFFA